MRRRFSVRQWALILRKSYSSQEETVTEDDSQAADEDTEGAEAHTVTGADMTEAAENQDAAEVQEDAVMVIVRAADIDAAMKNVLPEIQTEQEDIRKTENAACGLWIKWMDRARDRNTEAEQIHAETEKVHLRPEKKMRAVKSEMRRAKSMSPKV